MELTSFRHEQTTDGFTFLSEMGVELIQSCASDASVIAAARVSTQGERSIDWFADDGAAAEAHGLIRYLMKHRHGSPFEHNTMTFLVHAPIFVFRELMRHRIASYNEESGRYREMQPVFYVPDVSRKLVQVGKPGSYRFIDGNMDQYVLVAERLKLQSKGAYINYQVMLKAGIAREVARMCLPLNLYSSAYVTMNARALMNFLSLRVYDRSAMFPSHPMREIEMVAQKMEALWADQMPLTHQCFIEGGRVAP